MLKRRSILILFCGVVSLLFPIAELSAATSAPQPANMATLVTGTTSMCSTADVPKTGQTTTYATGDDGDLQIGIPWPEPRFTVASSGTGTVVTDELTGLIWPKDGGTPTVGSCTGGIMTWQAALDYVACLNSSNYLGQNDWRLPNINELKSLVNVEQPNMADWLNAQGFMNVKAKFYWSSSTYVSYPGYFDNASWVADMYKGYLLAGNKAVSYDYYAWPVRDGQSGSVGNSAICLPKTGQTSVYSAGDDGSLQKGIAWPSPRFTNIDGTTPISGGVAMDQLTGLIWTLGIAFGPAACSPGSTRTWQGALEYVACLNTENYLGYRDWRLSNRNELSTLTNYAESNGGTWLIAQGFNPLLVDLYLSSSTYASDTTVAWMFDMLDGSMALVSKADNFIMWAVRGGHSRSFADLAITKDGRGTGTISSSRGSILWSGPTGTVTVGSNVSVTLTPTPDSGSAFSGWSGACTGMGSCAVTMDAAKNVTATFDLLPVPVNGACGTSNGQTFIAAPATNLCSSGTTAGVSGSGPWTWTCDGQYSGMAASCSANIQTYALTFQPDGNGTLSGETSQTINHGGSAAAVSANANTNYHFVNWTGTGGFSTTSSNPLTVADVTSSMTITANFAHDAVNGECGTSNGQTFIAAPATNLCSSGTTAGVSGSGPWTWTCDGQYSGTDASCSANLAQTTPSGDLNGDGTVDVTDALKALRIASGIDAVTPGDIARGDVAPLVNGTPQSDGTIDIGDVVVILRRSADLVDW